LASGATGAVGELKSIVHAATKLATVTLVSRLAAVADVGGVARGVVDTNQTTETLVVARVSVACGTGSARGDLKNTIHATSNGASVASVSTGGVSASDGVVER